MKYFFVIIQSFDISSIEFYNLVSFIQYITDYVKFGLLGKIWLFGSPLTWLFVSERRSLARQGSVTGILCTNHAVESAIQEPSPARHILIF